MIRQWLSQTRTDYRSSDKGNVASMTAVAALLLLGAIGAAIDYTRMGTLKSQLQNAVDSGVLAAASFDSESDDARRLHGERVAEANIANLTGIPTDITLNIDKSGLVIGTGEMTYQPVMMHMFGFDTLPVTALSEAMAEGGVVDAEIVLVLDYSSSMNSKYVAMRTAAVNLVRDLSASDDAEIEFGLVPFAEEVFMTLDGQYAVGGVRGVPWVGCTISRRWPFVVSDKTPNGSARSKWGAGGTDCGQYVPRSLVVQPLTDNHAAVIAQLLAMRPHRGTNTSLGAEIGYQLISPNPPFAASEFSGGKQKFIVMLSDGEQTRPSYGPGDRLTMDQAASNLQSICDAAASNGVTVITVLYDTSSTRARSAMRNCASSPDLFMEATSGNISDRFAMIGEMVKSDIRLSR
ncbi:pilus assembly protein TadG-related protein [Algimonas porphyrae]|uniref:VWFA domain-containing protein n=1 Tax=Algimonas porphyrae TaxID=1128113 RepID=A0ABQ5V221_9PROT|nr:pilus assembly protein TadG-related protein [Algimonas porphyrae]GLQ21596.1 hypothetical protein GCM10007854_25510 [Algimonas porphyrae]